MTHPHAVILVALAAVLAGLPRPVDGQATRADSTVAWIARSRLVFGASRYAQDVAEAPASVTIVTAEEIETLGLRTLAEVLGLGAGVFTHYDRNYHYATFRGMARQSDFNTRILVLVDGHRINDAATDATGIGTDALIDVTAIERVEIISGPGSVQFGTNAVFGVVNIVTRQGRRLNGVDSRVEAGTFGVTRAVVNWGRRQTGRSEFLVSTAAERRTGRDLYYREFDGDGSDGVARGLDGEHAYRAMAKGRRGDFTMLAATVFRLREVPTASYATTFNDARLRTKDRTATVFGSYEHAFDDLSRVFASSSFDYFAYHGTWPYDSTVTHDFNASRTWALEGEYLRFLGGGNKLAVGGEARWLSDGKVGVYDEGVAAPYVDLNRSLTIGAAFAQLEWRLGDRSILYAGVRHDHYEGVGGTTNPRLALVLRPRAGFTVKALYGRAFRAPNLYELYYEDGGATQKAPPSLVPETVESTELSIDHQIGPLLQASVAVYQLRTKDLINLVTDSTDGLLTFVNSGRPQSSGVEFKLAASVRRAHVRAAWALQKASDNVHATPVNSPRHIGNLTLSAPIGAGSLGITVKHLGSRPTLDGNRAPAYTTVGASLLLGPFRGGPEFMLQASNLFNATYADPGGEEHRQDLLARDGRSLRVGLRYRFLPHGTSQ